MTSAATVTGRRRVITILLGVFLGLSAVGGATGMALGAVASAGAHLDGDHHIRLDPRGNR